MIVARVRAKIRSLAAGLLLLAALFLPAGAIYAMTAGAHDCACAQDQGKPCPVQMNCNTNCAGLAQLPAMNVAVLEIADQAPIARPIDRLLERSLRPALPPPRH